jgi:hypothetical protein
VLLGVIMTFSSPVLATLADLSNAMSDLMDHIDGTTPLTGQQKVELDWLKKNCNLTLKQKRLSIEPDYQQLSIVRQCELLGLAKSSLYYSSCLCTGSA